MNFIPFPPRLRYNEMGDNMSDQELKIRSIIDKLRPFLLSDGGNIEFVKFEDGIVYVRLSGACVGCSLIDVTLKDGIEEAIMSEVAEVKEVRNIDDQTANL